MRETLTSRTTSTVILVAMMIFTLFPLVGVFQAALHPAGIAPAGFEFPEDPQWGNFVTAWNQAEVLPIMWSSMLIVLGVVPAAVALSVTAGFGLSHTNVPFGTALGLLFIAGIAIPLEALISPLYLQMRDLGLVNTRWAIILPMIAICLPFGVFWMRTHFRSVPTDLVEAARLDGASSWRILVSVHLPLARPAISVLVVMFFLWSWNQFLLAIVLVNDPLKRTVAGALGAFQGEHLTDIPLLAAGSLIIIAPSLILFVIFQRQFSKALLQGSGR